MREYLIIFINIIIIIIIIIVVIIIIIIIIIIINFGLEKAINVLTFYFSNA